MFNKIKKRIFPNKNKGFLVLIAVMVSMILLSIGAFIAMIAIREIKLSSSVKASQTAFFAADTVLECALFKEFKQGGFSNSKYTLADNNQSHVNCGGRKFIPDLDLGEKIMVDNETDYIIHYYYITLTPLNDESGAILNIDSNSDTFIDRTEITSHPITAKHPYIKLIIKKPISDLTKPVYLQTFGHNIRSGLGVIERAIEVTY